MKRLLSDRSLLAVLIAASVALTACGGGGGGGGETSDSPPVNHVAPARPASAPSAASPDTAADAPRTPSVPSGNEPGSGTGISGNDQNPAGKNDGDKHDGNKTDDKPPPTPVAVNSVPIVIDNGVGRVVNMPYVSVTFCVPGTQAESQCATVDHMLLDTGSVGVRVMSTALGVALASNLPAQTGATNDKAGNAPLAECATFASGYTWGAIRRADISMGGETANAIPIQLLGDNANPTTPSECVARGGAAMNTVEALGANGIVGIGHLASDYPDAADRVLSPLYYYCPTSSPCTPARVPHDKQTANPIAAFATDNNGTIVRLPTLPSLGRASVTGELIFGIGTRANNALPSWPTFLAVSDRGAFTSSYKDRSMTSIIDSGSNALFFPDATLPVLAGWYAPAVAQNLGATMMSNTGNVQSTIAFSIANAQNLFSLGYAAHDNLGAPASGMLIWGLPFFYGRNVYTALSGVQAGTQMGPYVAF
ncbi:DUF3443 domain-containing protein [Paraburkholderia terrae]|uniref:DUF3443 domain-containing protein n=1 Tax=Paraburkholderia terrae TaxID=311230 RepID=UPI001EE1C9B8|nr:DUF3443 domain-containing protein [Paraburkholderia terrae]GJH02953.1 DUF3443 family protein [Paraburkholderia terrae]